ncbi:DMT family transporter [Curvivirga sp.]|uniref:DMT family transporter n=1 Tax=Curvivirga sp. TaxID=2856848 RepID=UPI003B5CB8F9
MSLDIIAITMVLSAAVLHASWNALVKSAADKWMLFGSMTLLGAIVCLFALPFLPMPDGETWLWLVLSTIIHFTYYALLLMSYKVGDLSKVYPIARGSAPILVALGSFLFAGEILSTPAYIAIILSSLGIMALAFEKGMPQKGDRKPIVLAILTGMMIGAYTITDGLGVRSTENKLTYIFWLFTLEGIPFLIWIAYRWKAYLPFLQSNWKYAVGGAFASHTAYGLVMAALAVGGMASVSALRETSVIIAAIIGTVLLKEAFGKWRIAAAGMVGSGVIFLNFFG